MCWRVKRVAPSRIWCMSRLGPATLLASTHWSRLPRWRKYSPMMRSLAPWVSPRGGTGYISAQSMKLTPASRAQLYKYVETRTDLLEVEVRGYIERIILKLVYVTAILFTFFIVSVFLLILLAIYLNNVLESTFAGYLIVAGFFAIVLLLLFIMKESFMKTLRWVLEKTIGQDEPNR